MVTNRTDSQGSDKPAGCIASAADAMLVPTPAPIRPGNLALLEAMLLHDNGTTIAEMVAATGWQPHSIRGALAGALKKRGLVIVSHKLADVRTYRAARVGL